MLSLGLRVHTFISVTAANSYLSQYCPDSKVAADTGRQQQHFCLHFAVGVGYLYVIMKWSGIHLRGRSPEHHALTPTTVLHFTFKNHYRNLEIFMTAGMKAHESHFLLRFLNVTLQDLVTCLSLHYLLLP